METVIHHRHEFVLYSVRNIKDTLQNLTKTLVVNDYLKALDL